MTGISSYDWTGFGGQVKQDFLDREGNYLRVTENQAVMLPMLEMSGTERARHVPEALMVCNRSSPHAVGLTASTG